MKVIVFPPASNFKNAPRKTTKSSTFNSVVNLETQQAKKKREEARKRIEDAASRLSW